MPRGRFPKPGSDWYLPPETYQMAQHFCLSYKEIEQEIMKLNSLRSPNLDGMPHGTNVSDPTPSEAIRKAELEKKLYIITESVNETTVTGRWWLFRAVTMKHMSFERLKQIHGCPFGKNQFGKLKREVYWRVAQKL